MASIREFGEGRRGEEQHGVVGGLLVDASTEGGGPSSEGAAGGRHGGTGAMAKHCGDRGGDFPITPLHDSKVVLHFGPAGL